MRSPLRSPLRSPTRSPTPSSIPLPKWRPRRTLIDLYNERDRTQWWWKVSAVTSAFAIMLGFLIVPSAFIKHTDLTVKPTSAAIVGGTFVILGYIISATLFFICKSWLFRLDCILGPCLSSCIFGLFNIIYNINIQPTSVPRWNASSIVAIILATVSTLIYLTFALITYRSIHAVRSRDAMHRHNTDGEALLPEDEMQRQQLLRLLLHRDGKKVSSEASRSTYRIDLPDTLRRVTTHLSAPQHVYGSDTRPSRSRSAPIEPFQDRAGNRTSPEPPTVHIQAPTLTPTNTFPQVQYTQNTFPASNDFEPTLNHYPQNTFAPTDTYQTNQDDYPHSPLSPANGYESHQNDLGIEGLVNTHSRTPSLPKEKREQLTRQLSARHPAERASYHIVDPPVPQAASYFTPQSVEELNRLSRESRRAEIELEDRGRDKKRRADVETDGVEFTPRINRVATDGWGRP